LQPYIRPVIGRFFFLALMNLSAHLLLLTIATVSKEPMGITGYEGSGLTCFVIKWLTRLRNPVLFNRV